MAVIQLTVLLGRHCLFPVSHIFNDDDASRHHGGGRGSRHVRCEFLIRN
jgi:hypothetical protein